MIADELGSKNAEQCSSFKYNLVGKMKRGEFWNPEMYKILMKNNRTNQTKVTLVKNENRRVPNKPGMEPPRRTLSEERPTTEKLLASAETDTRSV